MTSRIYLDNAATSWPKLDCVFEAMDLYAKECGAAAGRGVYRSSQHASKILASTRQKLAQLICASSSHEISFHGNGTLALNAAIRGVVSAGDHVVTTAAEHNSVLRVLQHLAEHQSVHLDVVPCDESGKVAVSDLTERVNAKTKLVVMTHASNVTGAIQNVKAVCDKLRDLPTLVCCDAAQTFGYIPIDVQQMGVNLLAAPGHKGGAGPLGTGFLYAQKEIADRLDPLVFGGTGSRSESLEMPLSYPDKMEAGNQNVAAIAGWNAGLSMLDTSWGEFQKRDLGTRLHERFSCIDRVRVYGDPGLLGVISINVDGLAPSDVASILDVEFGIETRSGFHCAALIHQYLGSEAQGTLRISAGHATTQDEIDKVGDAIEMIAAA